MLQEYLHCGDKVWHISLSSAGCLAVCHAGSWFNIEPFSFSFFFICMKYSVRNGAECMEQPRKSHRKKEKHLLNPIMGRKIKNNNNNNNNQATHEGKKWLKMRYTTMDVGNIFKSLFRIYKTTKLLMQHHNSLHTQAKKLNNTKPTICTDFLQVTLHKHTTFCANS